MRTLRQGLLWRSDRTPPEGGRNPSHPSVDYLSITSPAPASTPSLAQIGLVLVRVSDLVIGAEEGSPLNAGATTLLTHPCSSPSAMTIRAILPSRIQKTAITPRLPPEVSSTKRRGTAAKDPDVMRGPVVSN